MQLTFYVDFFMKHLLLITWNRNTVKILFKNDSIAGVLHLYCGIENCWLVKWFRGRKRTSNSPWSIKKQTDLDFPISRSSHRGCSIKKGVLKHFAKFTGKHLYERLFFKPKLYLKRDSGTGVLLWILRNF